MLKDNSNQISSLDSREFARGSTEPTIGAPTLESYDPRYSHLPVLTYLFLERAYVLFNHELFNGTLPPCLPTLQRTRGTHGYFSGDRYYNVKNPTQIADEIGLNPNHFLKETPTNVLSTFVHEMAHLWQHHFGKPSRGPYHNKQWAKKMIEIGLVPSDTGKPRGKQTGDRVSHYIQEGGPFACACREFLARETALLYQDNAYREQPDDQSALRARERKAASKSKYTCPRTGLNAWAKPGVRLLCGCCENEMRA